VKSFESKAPDAGSRFAERRSVPRFAFIAALEMTDPVTNSRVSGRVTEMSQHGCFAETKNPPTVNSVVQLRIGKSGERFETWARVVYIRSEIGVGLRFISMAPSQAKLLAVWLDGLREILQLQWTGPSPPLT
jgi:PilZ domain-containing protein